MSYWKSCAHPIPGLPKDMLDQENLLVACKWDCCHLNGQHGNDKSDQSQFAGQVKKLFRNAEVEKRSLVQIITWVVMQLSGEFNSDFLASGSLCRACTRSDRLLGNIGLRSTESWPVL